MTPSFSDKTVPETLEPVAVTVIGNTGNGGLPQNFTARTPGNQPNIVGQVITPVVAILVRATNLFFVTLSGLMGAAGIGEVTGTVALTGMSLKTMAVTALIVVFAGAIKDCATVFSGIEKKFPLASGSV